MWSQMKLFRGTCNFKRVAVMTTGLMAHILARAQVVKNRSAVMRSRQRIRDASKADYEKRKAEQELAAAAAAAQ